MRRERRRCGTTTGNGSGGLGGGAGGPCNAEARGAERGPLCPAPKIETDRTGPSDGSLERARRQQPAATYGIRMSPTVPARRSRPRVATVPKSETGRRGSAVGRIRRGFSKPRERVFVEGADTGNALQRPPAAFCAVGFFGPPGPAGPRCPAQKMKRTRRGRTMARWRGCADSDRPQLTASGYPRRFPRGGAKRVSRRSLT